MTKNGKPYETAILQDKTGTIDAKIWDPNSAGIADFDSLDFIEVYGDVTSFQGANQVNVKRIRKCQEGEYNVSEYLPTSQKNIDTMFEELKGFIESVQNTYYHELLKGLFLEDEAFAKAFCYSSAAKSVQIGRAHV